MLAVLLSAHAVPGAASLATIPEGPGTKVAVAICGGRRLAHWHALIGEHTARLLAPAPARLGICRGLAAVPPLWETLREAAKQIELGVYGEQTLF